MSSGNIDAGTNRTIKPSENVVKRMMTWAQIQEISEDSLFDIGSHGHNHLNLTKLTPADILEELTESKRDFQSHLGREPELFSYPGGFHNAQTKSQLEKVGFSCGFTSKQKVNPYQVDCLEVGRIAITQNHRTVASLAYALTHIIRKFPE